MLQQTANRHQTSSIGILTFLEASLQVSRLRTRSHPSDRSKDRQTELDLSTIASLRILTYLRILLLKKADKFIFLPPSSCFIWKNE
jgi:hypothetical protein